MSILDLPQGTSGFGVGSCRLLENVSGLGSV